MAINDDRHKSGYEEAPEENKPQLLSSQVLLRTPYFIVRDDMLLASGGILHHHTYVDMPGGVVILPLQDDDHLIMLRQFRYLARRVCWELPAGGILEGETPEDAARRELEEEVGVVASQLVKLTSFYPSNGTSAEVVHVFLAAGLIKTEQRLDQTEQNIVLASITIGDAVERALSGEIPGSSSIIAIMYFYLRRQKLSGTGALTLPTQTSRVGGTFYSSSQEEANNG